jgi:hypothetical protein
MNKNHRKTERDMLIKYLRRRLGIPLCDLLLAGLDEKPHTCLPHFYTLKGVTHEGAKKSEWTLEIDNCEPLGRGDEPLVVGALLKLFLERGDYQSADHDGTFYFGLGEICAELGWQFDQPVEKSILMTLKNPGLFFGFLSPSQKPKKNNCEKSDSLHRHFSRHSDSETNQIVLSGFLFKSLRFASEKVGDNDSRLSRSLCSVSFDPNFIAGLRDGKVKLANLILQDLRP